MAQTYFLDTWFFIALFDRRDTHHAAVRRLEARHRRDRLVTHDGVLTEFLNYFCEDGPMARREASRLIRRIALDVTVVASSHELFLRALALYDARPDKEYSLTDCMSMVVMRDRGIDHILTNDHHFRQEGFTAVSE
ncbi:MAG TPA: PIN domain-containing protein [Thermoanaerobaculia bacterium]|jgi:predicted nucleic acid-binding protein|nr:PIN domain-containing protein [Thermoanaerobaculia bacterium]